MIEEQSIKASVLNKSQKRKIHKAIRRVHLYLGLILIPWLFLYGVTALLFNHGMWFTDREDVSLQSSEPLLEDAHIAAQLVADELQEQGLQLVPESAQWIGSVSLKGELEGSTVRISLNPEGYGGMLRTRPEETPEPEWTKAIDDWSLVDEEQQEDIEHNIQQMIQPVNPDITDIEVNRYPNLRFQVEKDSEIYTVDVRHKRGLSIYETEGAQNLRTKMLRLHTMHGDPGYAGAKWVWARIVDVVGVAMMVWALSGIVMWWQIRGTRNQGAWAIALGIVMMAILSMTLWTMYGY